MRAYISLSTICATVASLMLAPLASAESVEIPAFVPYVGESGYQEIDLHNNAWYVAFHGTRKHTIALVEAAWLGRSAQLCATTGKKFIVELRYVGERVFESDELVELSLGQSGLSYKVAGFVYIPIFTSSGPREITPMLTPSKLSAIRCIESEQGLRAGKAAISVRDALASARKAGLAIP